MNGILLIDKPEGFTSHDVVGKLRRILKIKRIGHTGTLDPFATGLMVMLIGKATRLAQFLDKDHKEYSALIQFGSQTDTGDRTGSIIESGVISKQAASLKLAEIDWKQTLSQLTGEIMQTPPMFSAKKIGGKKLYELARSGKEIERKAVPVNIHSIDATSLNAEDLTFEMQVKCSAGTYIRTLAEDIGKTIGIPAHLKELRRTGAGKFKLQNAITFQQIESGASVGDHLITMSEAINHLPVFELTEERTVKTLNGLSTRIFNEHFKNGQSIMMVSNNELIAIGTFDAAEGAIRPNIVVK